MEKFEEWYEPRYGKAVYLKSTEYLTPLYACWNHQQAKIDKLEQEKTELELFVEFVKTRTDMVFDGLRFAGETLSLLQDSAGRLLAKIKSEVGDEQKEKLPNRLG